MCASLYMCQHPTAVSMYPCPLCQPFGILGCFFLGMEAGASHWSYSCGRAAFPADSLLDIHCFFPIFIFFSSRFPIPPFFPLQSVAWAVLPPGVIIPASREGASCFLGKVFFCCLLGLCDLQETLINKQISPSKKENDRRREAQRHFWHLLESCSCLPGKGFYWMLCGFLINYY